MKYSNLFLLLMFVAGFHWISMAQDFPDIEKLLESNNIGSTEDNYEELVNTLLQLSSSPLNVNTADFDSLKMLFLLSDSQIDQMLTFRKKYGNFIHVNELLWVPGISKKDVENIACFITLGEQVRRERLQIIHKRMKQEVLAKVRTSLPRQEGYKVYFPADFEKKKDYERKLENRFRGPAAGTLIKYKLNYGNHLQGGFTLKNDPGEAYFTRYQKTGFDFLSAHIAFSSEHFLRRFIIGDYRIQWGQGLVAWGGFASGKSDMTVGNEKSAKGIVPYTSTDENNYLRGGALSIGLLRNLTAECFFSQKKTDGNVMRADTLSEEDFLSVSLYESGYHRNYLECQKKHTLKERTSGLSVHWNTAVFKVGLNVLYYDFSPALIPGERVYQQYNDNGSNRWLVSVDYKTSWQGIYLFGETARSEDGGWATVDGLRTSLSWMSMCVLYRRYDKRYVSHYASGFGEYSNTSNEEGVYCGVDLNPLRNLKFNLYCDWFHFFSPRYGASLPGTGWEFLAQAGYRHKQFEHTLRYKCEVHPEDIKGGSSVQREKGECRYQLNYILNRQIELRTRFSMAHYHKDVVKEWGYMVYQDLIYSSRKSNLKVQYRMAWFKTDSYQSRIYAFENNVLYGYSFPAFMGKGFRTYLNLNWKPVKKLTCYLKTGFIIYPGLDEMSSGVTKVEGNKLCDITVQLRLTI